MNFFKILTSLGMEVIPAKCSDIRKKPKNKDFTGIVKGEILWDLEAEAKTGYGKLTIDEKGFYCLK